MIPLWTNVLKALHGQWRSYVSECGDEMILGAAALEGPLTYDSFLAKCRVLKT